MDKVTEAQELVSEIANTMADVVELVPQLHAPPPAPTPSEGENPILFYKKYWEERKEKYPFKTLGFAQISEKSLTNKKRWKDKGEELRNLKKKFETLLKDPIFSINAEELDAELKELVEESKKLDLELEKFESSGAERLSELRKEQQSLGERILAESGLT
eukprot:maker-scaffold_14-snap-gene-7.19-mRNA-1 protein AED:0.21 eAED:0.21 QI:135/1/1/1/1/1/2/165/159